ncbi:MAG: pyridoxal-dependent decarboxylase, exosortase A system-associated [Steroidobacteraceae bacterium]
MAYDFQALARQYGTPYFLYDADVVRSRVEQVRAAFEGLVSVYYAVKANPNLELLQAIRATVDGLDISSAGELEQALLAGYAPECLSFAGPAKSVEELSAAMEAGVGCISIESHRELEDCVALGHRAGRRVPIGLRVNPLRLNRSFGLKMGGRATQFGIDEEDLPGAVRVVTENLANLDFRGLHVYSGSQCFEPEGIVEEVNGTLRLVKSVEGAGTDVFCATVNLGGGFGASHSDESRQLPLAQVGSSLVPMLRAFRDSSARPRRVLFELGRFLLSDVGIYVARVISLKSSRGKKFCVLDGGLHHHLAAAGTFGAVLRTQFALRNLSRPGAQVATCTISGPSCNPTDLLGVDVSLPTPEVGDLIGVLHSGSYGLTASPILFLGRRTPAEIVVRDGVAVLGRRPHSITEFN